MAELLDVIENNRLLIVDALHREAERRQKVATAAAGDPTNDATAIMSILGDAGKLASIARQVALYQPTTPTEEAPLMPPTPQTPVVNVLTKAAPAPPPKAEPVEDDEIPIHATVLSPDAIAYLIGDEDDPLPEDSQSPSSLNTPFHGDQFGDFDTPTD